jgi:hypothetical protein
VSFFKPIRRGSQGAATANPQEGLLPFLRKPVMHASAAGSIATK